MIGGYKRIHFAPDHYQRVRLAVLSALFIIVAFAWPLQAQNTVAISQGFQTNEATITSGALVSLEPANKGNVQLANTDRVEQLVGVIGDKPLVTLSNNATEVQVVISGITPTLVSNINGDIKTGDKITASPVNGVGMKATDSSQVVGTAQEDFKNIQTRELTITDKNGKSQTVRAGTLPLQINVTYHAAPEDQESAFLPAFLRQIANSVAGREVPTTRVLLALLVLLAGFICIGVLLYSSVQSSIISIGRNPLSEQAVHKSLLEVGAAALGILLLMIITIYLILTT